MTTVNTTQEESLPQPTEAPPTFSPPVSTTADLLPERKITFGGFTRFIILVLGTLYLSLMFSSSIAYNATYVAMNDITTSPLYNSSMTKEEIAAIDWAGPDLAIADKRWQMGMLEKAFSFSSTYIGALLGTQPIGIAMQKYGAHKVMVFTGIIGAVTVGLTPLAISLSFTLFCVLRFISGFSLSNLFPVAGVIVLEWASVAEKGFFVAVLSGHVEFSAIFTMPIAGLLATSVSWSSVFYVHAVLVGLITFSWAVFYRDTPKQHPCVSPEEYSEIIRDRVTPKKKHGPPVRRIIHSIVIWAVWIAVIGNFFVAQFTITYAPMYLAYVLKFSSIEAGFIAMIPLVALLIIKFCTGLVSDKLTMISEVGKMRLFSSLSLLGSALFFLLVSFFPPEYNILDVILIMLPVALLGFQSGGYAKCVVVVSKQYSAWVMSIVQMVAVGSLVAGSFIIPAMTTRNTFEQWRNVFSLYAATMVLCNTIFVCFAKADPCKWTYDVPGPHQEMDSEVQEEPDIEKQESESRTHRDPEQPIARSVSQQFENDRRLSQISK